MKEVKYLAMKILVKRLQLFSKKNYFPVIILVLLCLSFFWKVFLNGQVPIPADLMTGTYYPWLDYDWGYPTGVAVKNPITSDVVSFTFPMQTLAIHLMKSGEWPLWNPYILTGTPLLANFQSTPFAVTNIVYWLFDTVNAWTATIVLQHIIAALATYFLLREFKISKPGSILAGFLFTFTGFNTIWSQWNAHTLTAAFIPLLILFEYKWLKEGKAKYLLFFAISLALQLLSGYPQIVIYTIGALGLVWLIFSWKEFSLKRTILLIMFTLLGIGLVTFQILPSAELLGLSQREVEPLPYDWAFLPWEKIITFLAPDYFGNHATGNYWGPQDYTSNTGFVSVIGILLALITVINRRTRLTVTIMLISVAGLLLSFPTPFSVYLWDSGFLGFQAASAHRALVLWTFGVSVLAGVGLDVLKIKKVRWVYTTLLIGLVLLFYFNYSLGQGTIKNFDITMVAQRNLVIPVMSFVSAVVILVTRKIIKSSYVSLLLILIAFIEIYWFWNKFTPFSDRHLIYPTTPVLEFLQQQESPFRTTGNHVIPINMRMPYEIETVEGYDAIYPSQISLFISKVNDPNADELSVQRRYAIIDDTRSNLLDVVNMKFLIVKSDDIENYDSSKYKTVFQDRSVTILENTEAWPRAVLMYNGKPSDERVEYIEYAPQKSLISFTASQDSELFISDQYYPGWKAFIDGKEVEISKAMNAFRSIKVPAGEHEVLFTYQPESFYNGLKISTISGGILIGSYLLLRYTKVREPIK